MISLHSCKDDTIKGPYCPICPWCPKPEIPKPPDIEAVPETLDVNDQTFIIECGLWRDFMPITPADGSYLMAHIKITEIDSIKVPDNMDAIFLWVFKGEEIWGSRFTDEDLQPRPPYELTKMARCGPKWDTGIYVDVIVKLVIDDINYYIKEEDVYILRTE